jgi:hypothetical protein
LINGRTINYIVCRGGRSRIRDGSRQTQILGILKFGHRKVSARVALSAKSATLNFGPSLFSMLLSVATVRRTHGPRKIIRNGSPPVWNDGCGRAARGNDRRLLEWAGR